MAAVPFAREDTAFYTNTSTDLVVTTSSSPAHLLANDLDIDGGSITSSVVSNPTSGTLIAFGTDGTFTYRPNTGFSGIDSFTYKINDGSLDSNVAKVTVAVGSKTTVRFNAPFQVLQSSCPQGKGPQCWKATDNYAVVLTLGEGAPKGLTFTWGHKTSEGFTVLVAEANNRKEGEPRVFPSVQPVRVTIDWVATQITRP